jgi:hypothetical protein
MSRVADQVARATAAGLDGIFRAQLESSAAMRWLGSERVTATLRRFREDDARDGVCGSCGRPLAWHFNARNQFVSCDGGHNARSLADRPGDTATVIAEQWGSR